MGELRTVTMEAFLHNRSRNPSPPPLRKETIYRLFLLLVVCEEQQKQEQEEFENRSQLERESFEKDLKRRREALQARHRQLQEDYADLDEIERCRLKRARLAASAVSAAISTQQTVQRRLWVKTRSQAWWQRCNNPSFPDYKFHQAFRMTRSTFERICEELGASVAKEDTMLRQAIPVKQRVAVCIWRLATGEPLRLVSKRFGLGISTCHKLVLEVCAAINDVLLPRYVQWPSHDHARTVADKFKHISGISDVIGTMYTTHIPIIAPKNHVAAYFNRRHTEKNQKTSYSVTLQGVVDTKGVFTDVCIGWPGSMSDEHVLEKSALYQRGLGGFLHGVWVVGGPGYPPLDWLLVPYVQRHLTWTEHAFNKKAEEVIKIGRNAFTRLKGRWRFLQKRAEVKLQELPSILGACCVLHNICEQCNESYDTEPLYQTQDDEMYSETIPWSQQSMQRRNHIAHNLLHSLPF